MLTRVTMPSLSATMEEGVIVSWRVKEGSRIKSGGILAEIESDKSVFEYECPCEGVVRKLLVQEGQTCPIQATIAIIGEENEEIPGEWLTPQTAAAKAEASPPPRAATPERAGIGPQGPRRHIAPGTQTGEGIGGRYRNSVRERDRAEGSNLRRRKRRHAALKPRKASFPSIRSAPDQSQGSPVETGDPALLRRVSRWT